MKRLTVTHIDSMTGSRGGEFWVLTLECGHVATRSIPKPRPCDVFMRNAWKRFLAPTSVKCELCSTAGRAGRKG